MIIDLLRFYRKTFKASATTEQGFSVLEAMVAMAILSAALIPLLSLQAQFVRTVESFERADVRMAARDNALTLIHQKNLTLTPAGEMDLGAATMLWSSELAGPPQMSRGTNGIEGRFEMALYDVNVEINYDNGQQDIFTVRGLGWRAIVSFSFE